MSVYSPRERWLPCDGCGAALQAPLEGGSGPCPHCRTVCQAIPRPDTRVAPSAPTDELARRERLRPQDGKPLLPPPGFEQLVSGSEIPPHKLQEARMVWVATRKQLLVQPGDLAAADRLMWLTMALRNTLTDERTIRALVEGALESVILPRHRQEMRGHLTRGATKQGDLASAEEWLAGCDPYSEDLQADSAYRISRALLDTAKGDFQAVLGVLGGNMQEVPIEDPSDGIATVLRANAWERLGRLDAAQAVLTDFMGRGGQSTVVEAIIAAMPPSWQLCPQSIQSARVQVREAVADRAASSGGGAAIAWMMMLMGGGIPLVLFAVFFSTGMFEWPMLSMLLFPAIFGTIGARMLMAANRQREIARGGLHGRGRILACTGTGTRINNVPVIKIDVQVQVQGHPPIQASVKKLMYPQNLVGREVPVIWHPKYPDEVVIEL